MLCTYNKLRIGMTFHCSSFSDSLFSSKGLNIYYSVSFFSFSENVMKLLVVGLALLVGGAWAQHSCKFFV